MRKGKSDDRLRILFYKIAAEGLRALKSASEGAEEKYVCASQEKITEL